MTGMFVDKDAARSHVWRVLQRERAAPFPFPVEGRRCGKGHGYGFRSSTALGRTAAGAMDTMPRDGSGLAAHRRR